MSNGNFEPRRSSAFVTTRWTCVMRARGKTEESKLALKELCDAYYSPVELFIRFHCAQPEFARDLTHDFFVGLLDGSSHLNAQQDKGRFRSYLLGAVKHFLSDERSRSNAGKRGGGAEFLPLDIDSPESGMVEISDPAQSPEKEFDRKWALTVLDRALTKLEEDHSSSEERLLFQTLKPWLIGDAESMPQSSAAIQLGLTDNHIRVAIHRLRKRFRECVKMEIGHTLDDPSQAEVELQALQAALAS